jgi:TetR/AcrR family tetracycline transcriptional repressor
MALDRQTILHHAFLILNESGPESLTLRRLAKGLGVQAPAIYWYFKSKQELLDEMGTQVLREAIAEVPDYDDLRNWQDWAMAFGAGLRRTLLRYREGARIFSGTYLTDTTVFDAMEANLRILTGAGFSLRDAVAGMSTLYCYTIGFVIEEQAVQPTSDEANARYSLESRNQRIDRDTHPLAYAAGQEMFTNYDRRFQIGLEFIVHGIARKLADLSGA